VRARTSRAPSEELPITLEYVEQQYREETGPRARKWGPEGQRLSVSHVKQQVEKPQAGTAYRHSAFRRLAPRPRRWLGLHVDAGAAVALDRAQGLHETSRAT